MGDRDVLGAPSACGSGSGASKGYEVLSTSCVSSGSKFLNCCGSGTSGIVLGSGVLRWL